MKRSLYPPDWEEISRRVREEAGQRCEWCDRPNHVDGVVLTVAHKDHTPANVERANLVALCQACHNRYDMPLRQQHAAETRRARKAIGMLPGLEVEA
jgi:5-methylcytosine-specific restriction endonuclease McrA